ncbi:MAG: hypothetical protein QW666_02945 [Candidatus Woesearchaeota archaeon]
MKWIILFLLVLFLISGCSSQNKVILSFTVKDAGTIYSEKIYDIFTDAGYECSVSARVLRSNTMNESFLVYDIQLNKEPDKESLARVIDIFDMENIVNIDIIQE